mmetsp:Transcript_35221/g.51734  ORF Transcript_35221/g.51734 Transcript_35221/m.51734 type:complete len:329 (+) Transcript_35221:43-1029(+)
MMSERSGRRASSIGSTAFLFPRGRGGPIPVRSERVRFGEEVVDLDKQIEPISLATFRSLMDEEPGKPFFTFSRVHSRSSGQKYAHLYSAQNIIDWYPLKGTTDPCTRGNIEKVEYFLLMKGQGDAIHVGDVYEESREHVSKSADYFVWSHTAEDEPSKMLSLLATAYLQILGLRNISSNDFFDTSNLSQLDPRTVRSPEQINADRLHGSKILHYISTRILNLIEQGELKCSCPGELLMSIRNDAARHLAQILVLQDPNIHLDNDDYARMPHIRENTLARAILQSCELEDSCVVQGESLANLNNSPAYECNNQSRSSASDQPIFRRCSI